MTGRRQRFVEEYLLDFNATQAAIRAGYSPKTAKQEGSRLLTYADVAESVRAGRERLAEAAGISQTRVLRELALLAFSDVGNYVIDDFGHVTLAKDAPEGARRAISSIKRRTRTDEDGNTTHEVELRLWDKPAPLKLAGKHVGLFGERPDIDLSSLPPEVFELLKRQLNIH